PASWPTTASVPDLRLPRTAPSPLSSSYRSRAEPPSGRSELGGRAISRRRSAVPLHLDRPHQASASPKTGLTILFRPFRTPVEHLSFPSPTRLLDPRRSSTAFQCFLFSASFVLSASAADPATGPPYP